MSAFGPWKKGDIVERTAYKLSGEIITGCLRVLDDGGFDGQYTVRLADGLSARVSPKRNDRVVSSIGTRVQSRIEEIDRLRAENERLKVENKELDERLMDMTAMEHVCVSCRTEGE